jgi:predicted nucleotide-binding protein (sugar kinase/HSP70/actin superfamily)
MKTIGIPRSLLYYKYFPLWKTFFQELGLRVVTSDMSDNSILENGNRYAIDEICIPLKLYYGHLENLIKKGVDYVFVPRYVSTSFGTYMCPKFLALPDMIRGTVSELPTVIEMTVDLRKKPEFVSAMEVGIKLGKSRIHAIRAFLQAMKTQKRFLALMEHGYTFHEAVRCSELSTSSIPQRKEQVADMAIAVIGHAYNVHDSFINMDILKKLKELGVKPVVLENLPVNISKGRSIINDTLLNYWGNEEEIISAMNYLFRERKIDGIVFLCSFCCGPDSLIDEILTRESKKNNVPYICIVLDEHSGQSGMVTRIEAFVDMITRKSRFVEVT